METGPTKFVGRISLSAESLRIQFIFGRHGNRTHEVCRVDIPICRVFGKTIQSAGRDTCPTEAFEVWNPAIRRFPGRGSRLKKCELSSWEVGRYGNLP